jgi:hypothetical protein
MIAFVLFVAAGGGGKLIVVDSRYRMELFCSAHTLRL